MVRTYACRRTAANVNGDMTDLGRRLRELLDRRWRSVGPKDPFLPSLLRWRARLEGQVSPPPSPRGLSLLDGWARRGIGPADGPNRYPWEVPRAGFHPEAAQRWRAWDADLKADDLERWAAGFFLPAVLGDTLEWLEAVTTPQARASADDLIRLVRRRVDADLAQRVADHEPWSGTFALSVLTARPRTLERFHPMLTALLMRHVADARDDRGAVLGARFPLFGRPLVGPTAQLGRGAVAIGQGLELLGGFVDFLTDEQRHDGGWGEKGQPTDLLTTLSAASFLASIDPAFDPHTPLDAIAASPEASRGWSVMDPRDASFVAAEVAAYVDAEALPFADRFRWPHVPVWFLDPHCGLPRFGAFQDLATLVSAVTALADARFEVAFLDLADFGRWNKDYGQAAGDDVLRFFGRFLREIPLSRVIQDGGDEILVVGAPGRTGLLEDIRTHFDGGDGSAGWPVRFAGRFPGKPCVPARGVVVNEGSGSELLSMRDRGGRLIGPMKATVARTPPPEGVFLSAAEAEALGRGVPE
jgi:hypothetical protein